MQNLYMSCSQLTQMSKTMYKQLTFFILSKSFVECTLRTLTATC